ncbi:FecR family protein [Mucilaginibacter defluvii]|uniref:FecR domain-containing protein n=1 Tax=Mucilaginibacter defluvii TaxID=1196019 RepID=A0ABP9FKN2_9SPHI
MMKDEIWNYIIKRFSNAETDASRQALDEWIAASPDHKQLYDEAVTLWMLAEKLPREAAEPVFENNVRQFRPKRLYIRFAAACAGLLVVFAALLLKQKHEQKNIVWVSHSASRGKMLSVTLPDSTTVMLNSGSTITYSNNFDYDNTRLIKLTGEAFFKVTHRKKQPFVVQTRMLKTVVLGTSFNVRAYINEPEIGVAVATGKVGVVADVRQQSNQPVFLLPNMRLAYNVNSGKYHTDSSFPGMAGEWQKGILTFEQTPVLDALQTISRRFNVQFDTAAYKHTACRLTAKFNNQNLHSILSTLKAAMNVQIRQTNNIIYIKGGTAYNQP